MSEKNAGGFTCPHCGSDLPELTSIVEKLLDKVDGIPWQATNDDCEPGVLFVASAHRPHFHRRGCYWMQYVSPRNLLEFSSHREAVEAGLKPCKTCRA